MNKYLELENGGLALQDRTRVPLGSAREGYLLAEIKSGKSELIPYIKPVRTDQEKISEIRLAVSKYIESTAKTAGPFGFDSIISAISYADDTEDTVNQPYGMALKIFRRDCWNKARELLDIWQSGGKELTPEEVINQMPAFNELM